MARAIHLFNTCERLILQRCRFCRHRSLILERSISTTIFSKPDSLFPTDLFAFGKSGREKNFPHKHPNDHQNHFSHNTLNHHMEKRGLAYIEHCAIGTEAMKQLDSN